MLCAEARRRPLHRDLQLSPGYVPCLQLDAEKPRGRLAQLQIQARRIDIGPAQPRTPECFAPANDKSLDRLRFQSSDADWPSWTTRTLATLFWAATTIGAGDRAASSSQSVRSAESELRRSRESGSLVLPTPQLPICSYQLPENSNLGSRVWVFGANHGNGSTALRVHYVRYPDRLWTD